MPVETYTISELPRRAVLRFMGYRGQQITPEVDARIDEGIARALELARPRASWSVFDIPARTDGGPICLDGCALTLPGASIARHLDGAVSCAVMAVTVPSAKGQSAIRIPGSSSSSSTISEVMQELPMSPMTSTPSGHCFRIRVTVSRILS